MSRPDAVTSYALRNISAELWTRVKRQAAAEGRTLRSVILMMLERYAREGMNGQKPTPPPRRR